MPRRKSKLKKSKFKLSKDAWIFDEEKRMLFFVFLNSTLALLLLFSFLDLAKDVGVGVKTFLYQSFGFSAYLILLFLLFSVFQNIREKYFSTLRFLVGAVLLTVSVSVFISVSWSEMYGGEIGSYINASLYEYLGLFGYVVLIFTIIISLKILKLVNFTTIHRLLMRDDERSEKHKKEECESEEGEDDEDHDEQDEENEDEESGGEDDGEMEYEEDYEQSEEYEDEEEKQEDKKEPKSTGKQNKSKKYIPPVFSLLNKQKYAGVKENVKQNENTIRRVFATFKINVLVEEVKVGPTFTRYSLKPEEGILLQKISSLQNNLELALAAHPIRIEAPIPGKSLVGIEVPNSKKAVVNLGSLLNTREYKKSKVSLPIVIGKTINGETFIKDLAKMPHVLIAGTTGSGKSVLIHSIIMSLIYSNAPSQLKFIFIDPKRVELTLYKGIPHLYIDTITNPKETLQALNWCVSEMELRYELLEKMSVRDIDSYNKVSKEKLPKIVVVIDELADLMQNYPREIETAIVRIAQKSRAIGMHLVLSTQRPSVNIITGIIKANIPVRIGLQVSSQIDSRTILDTTGCENLVGNGDLLFSSAECKKPIRIQGAFISDGEVKKVVNFLNDKNEVNLDVIELKQRKVGERISVGGDEADELYEEAKAIVVSTKKASTSLLQRKLKIGYSRAARLIDMLEEDGIVGPSVGNRPREILVNDGEE